MQNCAYMSLADSVIRGPPYNEYSIVSVIGQKYSVPEMDIAFAIRMHDWLEAKRLANEYVCSQFESKASADLSKFNRVLGPKAKYPTPGQIYDQVMGCIATAKDPKILKLKNTLMAHKICASISKNKPWKIHFKSMIVFEVYKLWYASVTTGRGPVVQVHCSKKPDMPSHWEHWPTTSTPAYEAPDRQDRQDRVPDRVPDMAYEEGWGWYDTNDKSAIRVYYK